METVTKIIEDVIAEVCDKICSYTHEPPPEGKDDGWLYEEGSPCHECPLNKLGG